MSTCRAGSRASAPVAKCASGGSGAGPGSRMPGGFGLPCRAWWSGARSRSWMPGSNRRVGEVSAGAGGAGGQRDDPGGFGAMSDAEPTRFRRAVAALPRRWLVPLVHRLGTTLGGGDCRHEPARRAGSLLPFLHLLTRLIVAVGWPRRSPAAACAPSAGSSSHRCDGARGVHHCGRRRLQRRLRQPGTRRAPSSWPILLHDVMRHYVTIGWRSCRRAGWGGGTSGLGSLSGRLHGDEPRPWRAIRVYPYRSPMSPRWATGACSGTSFCCLPASWLGLVYAAIDRAMRPRS